jgi:ABC-type Mn2+/Zn2+ transport system ATPase subunit
MWHSVPHVAHCSTCGTRYFLNVVHYVPKVPHYVLHVAHDITNVTHYVPQVAHFVAHANTRAGPGTKANLTHELLKSANHVLQLDTYEANELIK